MLNPHDPQITGNELKFGFERDLIVGMRTVRIRLMRQPVRSDDGAFWFGSPLPADPAWPDPSRQENGLNNTQGPFLYLQTSPDKIYIANDIFGGFRLYYCQLEQEFHVSDNFHHLASLLGRAGQIAPNRHEILYWDRHGYTTGGATLIEGLRKLPPAGVIELTSDGIKLSRYFRNIDNRPDPSVHTALVEQSLKRSLQALQDLNRPVVLLFSGGHDSALLAALMKELGIDTTLVFLRGQPGYSLNLRDHHRAVAVADALGLPLVVAGVSLDIEKSRQREIVSRMLPDRHFAVLHFEGMKLIAKMFGTDIIIVTGQNCDSVLSFGPSSRSRGDFVARLLLNESAALSRKLGAFALSRKTGRKWLVPKNRSEFHRSLLDPFENYAVIDSELDHDYVRYIDDLIERLSSRINNDDSLKMYLRLLGYTQGSDTRVITQSCMAAGVDSVAFPYVDPAIVYATIERKDSRRELYRPKYAIRDLLDRRGIDIPRGRPVPDADKDGSILSLQVTMNNCYSEEMEKLFSQ